MDGIEAMGERQGKGFEEEACIHRQGFGAQPGDALEVEAVDGVGMRRVDFGGARHVGGDDVDFLAAEALVDLGRPDSSAALGGEEEFG